MYHWSERVALIANLVAQLEDWSKRWTLMPKLVELGSQLQKLVGMVALIAELVEARMEKLVEALELASWRGVSTNGPLVGLSFKLGLLLGLLL